MTQKIGNNMLIIGWLLFFCIAVLAIDEWLDLRENPNRSVNTAYGNDGSKTVVLARNPQHHYLVNALVNGQEVTFLVDTGATDVVLSAELAEQLKLQRGRAAIATTANGQVRVYGTVISELKIGGITLRNIAASINPGMAADMPALLGMSALRNVEIIQRNGELSLKQT